MLLFDTAKVRTIFLTSVKWEEKSEIESQAAANCQAAWVGDRRIKLKLILCVKVCDDFTAELNILFAFVAGELEPFDVTKFTILIENQLLKLTVQVERQAVEA